MPAGQILDLNIMFTFFDIIRWFKFLSLQISMNKIYHFFEELLFNNIARTKIACMISVKNRMNSLSSNHNKNKLCFV